MGVSGDERFTQDDTVRFENELPKIFTEKLRLAGERAPRGRLFQRVDSCVEAVEPLFGV
jgi:hypothetical protein